MPSGPLHISKSPGQEPAQALPPPPSSPASHTGHLSTPGDRWQGHREAERTARSKMQVLPRHSGPGYPQTCHWQEGLWLQLCDHLRVQEGFWENPFTKTRPKLSPGNPLHGLRSPSYEDFITNHPKTWE